ncbi:MAG: PPOX class F420-dependent oxidoreductase [Dehalococcoidia bacterium]
MSYYSEAELAFIASQQLGRLGTTGPNGQPHVSPVRFRLNQETGAFEIGGRNIWSTKKWRDVQKTGKGAFVLDDVAEGRARGIEVRGPAETVGEGDDAFIRVTPRRIASWGIDTGSYKANIRSVGNQPAS